MMYEERKLSQQVAARLCGTDQPTFSKVFRRRMQSVTTIPPARADKNTGYNCILSN